MTMPDYFHGKLTSQIRSLPGNGTIQQLLGPSSRRVAIRFMRLQSLVGGSGGATTSTFAITGTIDPVTGVLTGVAGTDTHSSPITFTGENVYNVSNIPNALTIFDRTLTIGSFSDCELTWWDHGVIVQDPWYVINGNEDLIAVIETLVIGSTLDDYLRMNKQKYK